MVLIFPEIRLWKGTLKRVQYCWDCLIFSSDTFSVSFSKGKSYMLVWGFFCFLFFLCVFMDVFVVINYRYDLFAILMWVICIKEYLYQNDQKPKNYLTLNYDNVTCWRNKKILSSGNVKLSSLVWTIQILRCLRYEKYKHHRIIYHYVYGNRKFQ